MSGAMSSLVSLFFLVNARIIEVNPRPIAKLTYRISCLPAGSTGCYSFSRFPRSKWQNPMLKLLRSKALTRGLTPHEPEKCQGLGATDATICYLRISVLYYGTKSLVIARMDSA